MIKQSIVPIWNVSDSGEVISIKTNKILKPYNRRGYPSVKYNGKHYTVHTLVAKAFIGDIEEGMCVNHIDGNKENNNVNNLEIVTFKENLQHALDNKLRNPLKGEKRPNSKISEEEAENLIIEILDGFDNKYLSEKYNLSVQCIRNIRNKQTWKHVWEKF